MSQKKNNTIDEIEKNPHFDYIGRVLKDNIAGLEGEPIVSKYVSGFSNENLIFSYHKGDYVVRYKKGTNRSVNTRRILNEFHFLESINPVYSMAPKVIFQHTETQNDIPDFFVMQKISGKNVHSIKECVFSQDESFMFDFLQPLIVLHRIDAKNVFATRLPKASDFKQKQFIRWSNALKPYVRSVVFEKITKRINELAFNPSEKVVITHGDYHLDNVLFDIKKNGKIQVNGVLDWELSSVASPMFDVAVAWLYFQFYGLKGFVKKTRPERFLDYYKSQLNFESDNFHYYYLLAVMRTLAFLHMAFKKVDEVGIYNKNDLGFFYRLLLEENCDDGI